MKKLAVSASFAITFFKVTAFENVGVIPVLPTLAASLDEMEADLGLVLTRRRLACPLRCHILVDR